MFDEVFIFHNVQVIPSFTMIVEFLDAHTIRYSSLLFYMSMLLFGDSSWSNFFNSSVASHQ